MHSAHLRIPSNVRTGRHSSATTVPFSRLVQLQEGFGRTSESVSIRWRRRKGTAQKYSIVQNAERFLRLGLGRRSTEIRPGCGLPALDWTGSERCGRKVAAVRVEMALTVKEEVAAPSWESLAETLGGSEEKQKLLGGERLANARERVFSPGEEPKLVFYRDSYSWSSDCERVWLQLEEKKISHRVEKIDMSCYGEKPEWYKSMVPSGLLPAVKLDGEVLTESVDILFRLEEKFRDNPLMPSRDAPEYEAVEELLNLEKTVVKAWIARLIRSDGEDVEDGAFESAIDRVNSALMRFPGPYFLGSQFTLLDILFAPSLERIAASMPYWQGIRVRGTEQWPALNAWFDAMDARPSYQAMKSDDFGIAHNLEVQLGSCSSSEAGAFYRALIDGTYGSWDLPLKPEETAWGFDDGTGRGGAKEEAAQSLIENHEEMVEYAIRYVIDGEKHKANVDRGFRHVAQALLMGVDNVELPKGLPSEVGVAATYLKDRVSVPRDLTYPAARQLRAHLQWLVKHTDLPLAVQQNRLDEDSGLNSWLYPSREELPDEKEMTIFDHLEELRDRLAVSAGAIGVAILGCFFFSKDLIKILEAPVYTQGVRFLQLSPGEFFFTTLKVSGYCGLLLGSPVLLYEIIAFVLPGLTRSERKFLGPIVLGSSVLFYAGVVFSYIVLTPAALNFFVNYAEGAVESFWSIDQYFEFVLVLLFSTGLSFQVPVIQLLLGQTRLVSGDQMLSVWRYVVVGSVAVAAVLTPSTDPLTQILLAGPLMGLYLGGAFLVKALVQEAEPEADS